MGADYTEAAIREHIDGRRIVPPRAQYVFEPQLRSVNLLIDIQTKVQSGKRPGFERWAKVPNLKAMSHTLIYLQEQELDRYETPAEKASAATKDFNAISDTMKELESKMSANVGLQRHIVNYSKTRRSYVNYSKAGYSKKFRGEYEADILLHQSAKKAFDELGISKIPTVKGLRDEYASLLAEKKNARREYIQAREDMKDYSTLKRMWIALWVFPLLHRNLKAILQAGNVSKIAADFGCAATPQRGAVNGVWGSATSSKRRSGVHGPLLAVLSGIPSTTTNHHMTITQRLLQ